MENTAIEETKLTLVQSAGEAPNEPAIDAASETAAPASEPAKAKTPAKTYDTLEAVLQAMNEQDEQLRQMKTQLQDMISTGGALKKAVKQLVQSASKNDTLEIELSQARRKLSTMKNFLNTVD